MTCDDEDTKFVIIIQVSVHFLVYQSCNGVNAPYDVSYCPDNRERHSKGPNSKLLFAFLKLERGFYHCNYLYIKTGISAITVGNCNEKDQKDFTWLSLKLKNNASYLNT